MNDPIGGKDVPLQNGSSIHKPGLQLMLVLAGGDEQLASQPCVQDGSIDKVVVKKDADIGEIATRTSWGLLFSLSLFSFQMSNP